MLVTILTKAGCAKCLSAKAKLAILGVKYTEETATIPRLVEIGMAETDIPVFVIDGKSHTYPAAMVILKGIKNV